MRISKMLLPLGGAAVLAVTIATMAQERDNPAWKECRYRASSVVGTSPDDVRVSPGWESNNGERYILNWEARRGDAWRASGYCEVDRRDGRIVRVETKPKDNGESSYDPPDFEGKRPHVKVDTDGRGFFNSRTVNLEELDRAFVDTKDRPSVTLRGRSGARITFYGRITDYDGRQEMTMHISGTDRGEARGRMLIRLNGDHNEVERIEVRGSMEGDEMRGEFNRNR